MNKILGFKKIGSKEFYLVLLLIITLMFQNCDLKEGFKLRRSKLVQSTILGIPVDPTTIPTPNDPVTPVTPPITPPAIVCPVSANLAPIIDKVYRDGDATETNIIGTTIPFTVGMGADAGTPANNIRFRIKMRTSGNNSETTGQVISQVRCNKAGGNNVVDLNSNCNTTPVAVATQAGLYEGVLTFQPNTQNGGECLDRNIVYNIDVDDLINLPGCANERFASVRSPAVQFTIDTNNGCKITQNAVSSLGFYKGRLGESVDIDGTFAVVAAPGDKTNNEAVGMAYVFQFNSSGTLGQRWSQVAAVRPAGLDPSVDEINAVAISGDKLVLSSQTNNNNQGAAWVFQRASSGTWNQLVKLSIPGTLLFGNSVDIDGDVVVVGAMKTNGSAGIESGSAYAFLAPAYGAQSLAAPTAPLKSNDQFGFSVSTSGGKIAVSAPVAAIISTNRDERVYIFTRSGSAFNFEAVIRNPAGLNSVNRFGADLELVGNEIIIGAPNSRIGANDQAGTAHLFSFSGTWVKTRDYQRVTPAPAASDKFGTAVSFSGNDLVIGAPGITGGTGAAYQFNKATGQQLFRLQSGFAERGAADQFGQSLVVRSGIVLIGARLDDYVTTVESLVDPGRIFFLDLR